MQAFHRASVGSAVDLSREVKIVERGAGSEGLCQSQSAFSAFVVS